jgi:HEAT repeat protein
LITALSDPSTQVRLAALQGLTLDTGEELMLRLIEMTHDPVPEMRLAVVDALQRFSDGRVVPSLAAALADEDPRVARQAQRSLDHLESVVARRGGSSDQ